MSLYPISSSGPEKESRHGLAGLIRQLFSEMTALVQQHIELTKIEIREEAQRLSKATVLGAVALMFLVVSLVFLGNLITIGLMTQQVNLVAATLITFLIYLLVTIILAGLCYQQIRSAQDILKHHGQ